VTALTDEEVPMLKVKQVKAKQKVQDWVENPAGVARGEQSARFGGDHNQPQNCGDPRF